MREQIEKALGPLVGLPLCGSHRAGDMQCFAFGARHPAVTFRGEPAEVSDYSLHVQCAWRIVGPAGIVVARRDLYYPASEDPYENLDEFDYDGPIPNRRSVRMAALLEERRSSPLVVLKCSADRVGGIALAFTGDFTLELFPDDSLEDEHWRLLSACSDAPHFVVTGAGIEWPPIPERGRLLPHP